MAQLFLELGLFLGGLGKLFAGKTGLVRLAGFIHLLPLPFTFIIMMPMYAQTNRNGSVDMSCVVIDWGFLIFCGVVGSVLGQTGKGETSSNGNAQSSTSNLTGKKVQLKVNHAKPVEQSPSIKPQPLVAQDIPGIRFSCLKCGQKYEAPSDMEGNRLPCEKCGNSLIVSPTR